MLRTEGAQRKTKMVTRCKKSALPLVSLSGSGDLVEPKFNVFSVDQEDDSFSSSTNAVDQAHSLEGDGIDGVAFPKRVNECLMSLGQGRAGCQSLKFFLEALGFLVPGFWRIAHGTLKLRHEVSHLLHGLINFMVGLVFEPLFLLVYFCESL